MLIPIYGFLKGDTMGLIVLIHDHQRVHELASSLQQAAAPRVAPTRTAAVYLNGTLLDPGATVAQAGIEPLDRVDVLPEREP